MGIYKKLTVVVFSAMAMWAMTACQKSEVANGAANATANKAAANSSNSANTSTAANTAVSGSADLSTPTAAYKTAYNARKNKDIPTLKRVLSKDVQDFLTEIGQADDADKKSLDDMLKELCLQPQAPSPDVRNEKIDGDKATLEYKDESGEWQKMDLLKDNGDWKISIGDLGKPPMDDSNGSNKPKGKK